MNIKTITCHHVYNHGAYLQAYALITYLKSLGHDAEIINYRPDYLRRHFKLWLSDKRYNRIGLGWLYVLAKLPSRIIALKRKKRFDKFYTKYIPVTATEYHSFKELRDNPPYADCYIAGSDQIWNTTFPNGTDPGFYLDFGSDTTKKLSYAASFATDTLKDGTIEFVTEKLKNFDKISVREYSGVKLLNSLGFSGIEVVDPVFLLTAKEWDAITSKEGENEKYLLVYDFENSPEIQNIATRLARTKNLKILSIGSRSMNYTNKDYINYAPDTFIGLIKNAEYIISNSFHGTAFSLIYNKNFFVVNRADGLNTRMRDLLAKYNLSSRLISTSATNEELIANIDYSKVLPLIEKDIDQSKRYLIENLSN